MMRPLLPALFAAALLAGPVQAHEVKAGTLTLSKLHVKASLAGSKNTAGYLTIVNAGPTADRLVSVSCTCAAKVQIHEMQVAGTIMKMRHMPNGFGLRPGGVLELKPGGSHLMLLGLTQPLVDGTNVQMTLKFEKAGTVVTNFHVKANPGEELPMPGMKH